MRKQLVVFTCMTMIILLGWVGCDNDSSGSGQEAVTPYHLVSQGKEAFTQGRYDQALQKYRQALTQQPGSANLHNLIGMALRFSYNQNPTPELKNQEIAAFKKAVELDPKFTAAWVNLGSSYYFSKRQKEAADPLRQALKLMPHHPDAERIKEMINQAEGAQDTQQQ